MATQNCEILETSTLQTVFSYLYKDINIKPVLRKIICDDFYLIETNQDGFQ
jgi:hypothetical protein